MQTEPFFYGDGGTIHHTYHVDVEVDEAGTVKAVWYRCRLLPFKQHLADGVVGEGNPKDVRIIGVTFVAVEDEPQNSQFDPERPELGWTPSTPLPYYDDEEDWAVARWLKKVLRRG